MNSVIIFHLPHRIRYIQPEGISCPRKTRKSILPSSMRESRVGHDLYESNVNAYFNLDKVIKMNEVICIEQEMAIRTCGMYIPTMIVICDHSHVRP